MCEFITNIIISENSIGLFGNGKKSFNIDESNIKICSSEISKKLLKNFNHGFPEKIFLKFTLSDAQPCSV